MEELVAERILLMQGCDDLWDELMMLKCLLPFLLLPSLDPVHYWVTAACHLHSGTLQKRHSSTDSCKSLILALDGKVGAERPGASYSTILLTSLSPKFFLWTVLRSEVDADQFPFLSS